MSTSIQRNEDELYVDRLMQDLAEGVGKGEIPASIFSNERVYKRELRQVFGRCWVYMAHESEIPNPGDFVVRKIGEDDFIVARDTDGGVNVMLNACSHRGVQLCRSDSGNAQQFRCLYHGWTFATDGKLRGAPVWKKSAGTMCKEANGLVHAAQVGIHQGLIFATLDKSAPPLTEYLGGIGWYLDLIFGLNEHGVEVVGPPQRFVIPADWKSPAENGAGDDFHLVTLHRSASVLGAFPVNPVENMKGYHVQAAPGHSLSLSMAMSEEDPGPRFIGFPEELIETFNTSSITEDQLQASRMARVVVGNVFPNLTFIALPVSEDSSKPPVAAITVRVWQPKGPDHVEVWNWFFVYKNATPEQKQRSYSAGLGTFSMAGLFEMDDSEPWATISKTGSSVAAELLDFKLNYQRGLPGIGEAELVESFPGPGVVYTPRYEEGVQRNLYKFYAGLMQSTPGEWPDTEVAG
ncbi:MAG: ring-hydroxylating oxygenase subunit alpha [Sphingomonadales bacterium]|nr:MAG: ring-hydroxylating oxygenase subunit alpha [Sphingomonadales bacterium]TNF05614.1 MAG: ring-hydroxylating oxygenase subunit alpha [Sphingomonadales bacterium]